MATRTDDAALSLRTWAEITESEIVVLWCGKRIPLQYFIRAALTGENTSPVWLAIKVSFTEEE